ncbi:hypothetical protein CMEL01_14661 [Colletotrichum melonis]|uniref:Uncharacterized protein n=1 Tax=Colletotrichum melonis TaxID=1209925 RepID=A0AAI9URT2_9PEZI|nr:hypothetical protein CMEL01_14661 [Colletotrichum melonis]
MGLQPRNLIMGKSTYPPYIIISLTICIDAGPKERMFMAEDESSPHWTSILAPYQKDYIAVLADRSWKTQRASSATLSLLFTAKDLAYI